ncbi:MAG: DUF2318 domain-containing protein [Clostridia bacterium]|nr:DUF2318 domain-containing protein [Clostridia bacterium]
MVTKEEKKQRFISEKKSNKKLLFALLAFAVVFAVGITVFFNKEEDKKLYNIGAVNYGDKIIEMKDINNTVKDGKIIIPLKDIKENGIIFTQYSQNGKTVPLTAFVTPSGDVTAAVSMCEPCVGIRFHIDGKELVCNACGTRWTLDGLEGVWGGCLKYPPDTLNYEVDPDGTNILLDEQEVIAWQPRK